MIPGGGCQGDGQCPPACLPSQPRRGGVRPSVRLSVHPLAAPAAPAPAAGGRCAEGGDAAGPCRPYLSERQRAGPLCQAGQRRTPRQQAPPGAGTGSPPPEHPLPGARGQRRGRLCPRPAPAPPPPREPRRISGALSGRQRRRLRAAGPERVPYRRQAPGIASLSWALFAFRGAAVCFSLSPGPAGWREAAGAQVRRGGLRRPAAFPRRGWRGAAAPGGPCLSALLCLL